MRDDLPRSDVIRRQKRSANWRERETAVGLLGDFGEEGIAANIAADQIAGADR